MNTWHFFFVLFLALNNQTCEAHVDEIFLIFYIAFFNFQ